ncbi:hypothetical protein PHA77_01665 [Edwardsiella tarda]|uniref:hypothetical protein n=1 Tax=Edwardsiella tarda TaxID=636 RepID=UPI002443FA30|nr:hypothetical protein [Edwardsiella tarda]WGE29403.1 hypothetical protein PHA77_01665 [Edwardsiella tarda]
MLRLNGAGTGFMTVRMDDDTPTQSGALLHLDIGYDDQLMPYFTGYVESESRIGQGVRKLLVREAAAILQYPLNVSMQHPTLVTATAYIEQKTGLRVQLPSANYTTTPIPHLTHNGNGYQLLAMLGRAFSIPDFVWYPSIDGIIFIGSFADCRFARTPITLPPNLTRDNHSANGWTFQTLPALRPGVILNGHRITQVHLHGDDMTVTWDDGRQPPLQRQMESFYPELGNKTHLTRTGRIIAPTEATTQGDLHDPFRPRYAVNVQLLDEFGNPAHDTPVYNAVPLPIPMMGSEAGLFSYPPPGTRVTLTHIDGRPDKPSITNILGDGQSLPDIRPGEQLQQQRAEVFQRVNQAGDWHRQTDRTIREKSTNRTIENHTETRTSTTRELTVNANNTETIRGTDKRHSGNSQHLSVGDYAVAAGGQLLHHADSAELDITHQWTTQAENATHHVTQTLDETIGQVRKSAAGLLQRITAPEVWLGDEHINTLTLMLALCDTVQQLAEQVAQHSHTNEGSSPPTNSQVISGTAAQAGTLKTKYAPLIKQ